MRTALGLRSKVTLTLAAGFATVSGVFLLVLLPLQREQRSRLVEQEVRLLETLKENHQRNLIHDLLSENSEALSIDLAELARQPGILWVRVDADQLRLSATADRGVMQALLGRDAVGDPLPEDAVLLLWDDGRADVADASGRPLLRESTPARPEALPPSGPGASPESLEWDGRPVLRYQAELRAADATFGRLELLSSLAEMARAERLTRLAVLGAVLASFLVLVVALDRLMSRLVLRPVQQVARSMEAASRGDLGSRLDVGSRDEIGAMAESFNTMVADLSASKRRVEDYSRNLEAMVEERTRELRQSEARARELWAHLETVLAHVATGVVSLDADGRVATLNERAAEVLGRPRADLSGHALRERLGAEHPLCDLVEPVLGGREPRRTAHLAWRTAAGRRTLAVVASALPPPAGGVVVAIEDITQLVAAQRLEAWKEAVERVIHEIKNPLTPVGLAAQALRTAWDEDPARFETMFPSACDLILRSVQDLRTLIGEFTRFSRLPPPRPRPHDVNVLVRDVVAAWTEAPPAGMTLRLDLAPELPPADVDVEQVRRVLLNLVSNGFEAMEQRPGELVVRTGRDGSASVVVEVEDAGCGIEDVDRIFEPYYTTKPKGTGLGLIISRQVVEEHGGRIEVHSRPGEGTLVRVVLPATRMDTVETGGDHGRAECEGDARQRAGVVRPA